MRMSRRGSQLALPMAACSAGAEDPDELVILLDVADVDRARAWTTGADLKAAMQNAEVVNEPVIHIVT
jgi:hypothetical protein